MGDIFNEIVIFLEEYYVYVIGVGLILVLMLVGLLASRKKAKKGDQNNETMANINEVKTGSINDVAATVQNDVMQPTDVVTFSEEKPSETTEQPANASIPTEPQAAPEVAPSPNPEPAATPVDNPIENVMPTNNVEPSPIEEERPINENAQETIPMFNATNTIPTNEGALGENNFVTPIVEENQSLEEITPVEDDRFDKTEVIDFSTEAAEKPEDIKPAQATPFIIDDSQFNVNQNTLNGDNDSDEVPKV